MGITDGLIGSKIITATSKGNLGGTPDKSEPSKINEFSKGKGLKVYIGGACSAAKKVVGDFTKKYPTVAMVAGMKIGVSSAIEDKKQKQLVADAILGKKQQTK